MTVKGIVVVYLTANFTWRYQNGSASNVLEIQAWNLRVDPRTSVRSINCDVLCNIHSGNRM